MSDGHGNNEAGTKAFAGIVAIVAVIAGVYAMVEPMGQRIDFLEKQLIQRTKTAALEIKAVRDGLATNNIHERSDKSELAALQSQFKGMRELFILHNKQLGERLNSSIDRIERRLDRSEQWREKHDSRVRGLNAVQTERIKAIERILYGKPLSATIGEVSGAKFP